MKRLVQDLLPPFIYRIISLLKARQQNMLDNKMINIVKNNKYKNLHKNDRCFIVGTGPSIKEQDLTLLKDEYVIGVSGLFQHKDIDIMKPSYYVLPPVFRGHGHFYGESDFVNWLENMDKALSNDTVMVLDIGDKKYIDKYKVFTNKKVLWANYLPWNESKDIKSIEILSMPAIWSVSESALQTALYLGFKEIYILGFDHDWFNGLFNYGIEAEKARLYFKSSIEDIKKEHEIDSEFQMLRHAKIFKKYKMLYALKKNIYNVNANANTYVDTFPKVKFESLF